MCQTPLLPQLLGGYSPVSGAALPSAGCSHSCRSRKMGRVALGMSTCSLMLLSCALGKLPVRAMCCKEQRVPLLCGAVLGSEDSPFYSQRAARCKANSRVVLGSPVQSACVSVSHHAEPCPCCFKEWFLLVCTCVGILSINQLAN